MGNPQFHTHFPPTLWSTAASVEIGQIPLIAEALGTLTKTLGSLSVASAGALAVRGTLTKTLGSLSVVSAGTVAIVGTFTKTLNDVTVVSVGLVAESGTANDTLDSLVIVSAGAVAVHGTLSVTLQNLTDVSAEDIFAFPPSVITGDSSSWNSVNGSVPEFQLELWASGNKSFTGLTLYGFASGVWYATKLLGLNEDGVVALTATQGYSIRLEHSPRFTSYGVAGASSGTGTVFFRFTPIF